MNMLLAEYDYATDIAVQRQEEREIALEEGKAIGIEKGAYQNKLETARILKQLGDSNQKIRQVTGLSEEEIAEL